MSSLFEMPPQLFFEGIKRRLEVHLYKTGTSQVGAIPKAQKAHTFKNILRTFFMENSQKSFAKFFEKPKRPNWRARCPPARAASGLKRGTI